MMLASSMRLRLIGPLSGVMFAVSVVISTALLGSFGVLRGTAIESTRSNEALLVTLQKSVSPIRASSLITLVGLGFLAIFLADLRNRARGVGVGWPADGVLVGGLLVIVAWLLLVSLQMSAYLSMQGARVEAVQSVVNVFWGSLWLYTPGLLAVGIGATAMGFGTSFHPRWLGAVGALVAVGLLVPRFGLLVFIAWVLAASVTSLVRGLNLEDMAWAG